MALRSRVFVSMLRRSTLLALAACSATSPALSGSGTRVSDEDALFHQDALARRRRRVHDRPRRWLFGDSFVAPTAGDDRSEATIVRNSIAVLTGDDPANATMQVAWRDGSPPD
jgi:hypothetical protein